jgi:hypothetical protein
LSATISWRQVPDHAFDHARIPISPPCGKETVDSVLKKAMADNGTDAVRDPVTLGADEWLARLAELPLAFQPGRAGATTSRSPRRSAKTSHSTVDWSPWSYEHRSHRVIAGAAGHGWSRIEERGDHNDHRRRHLDRCPVVPD